MCCETSFYGFVNLVFFSELKAPEDFVRVSAHSVDHYVYLYLVVLLVKASSNAIAFEAFDPLFPLLRFL